MKGTVVLVPVYRNQAGLDRSLESLRMARGSFDVIVVDDGSPDPIQAPPRLRGDIALLLLRLVGNSGVAAALNVGLGLALERGYDYIGRLDAADTVSPDRFERQVQFLEANPSCAVVSSSVDFVDLAQVTLFRYPAPRDADEIARRLHVENCIMHPASTIRASALREVGLYREDFPGAEDYELFLRMARRFTLAAIPEALTRLEYDPCGLSVAGRRRQRWSRLRLQFRYFDARRLYSFVGVARTLVAMVIPSSAVYRFKRAFMG